jgi:hypothetical protein
MTISPPSLPRAAREPAHRSARARTRALRPALLWSMSCALVVLAACDLAELDPADAGQTMNAAKPADAAPAAPPPSDAGASPAAPPPAQDAASAVRDASYPADAGPTSDAASGAPDAAGEAAPEAGAAVQADGGTADAALAAFPFPPLETSGMPITAPDRVWTYVEFPDTRCRDGTRAGVTLNLNKASKKLLIYLEGAVYCFDGATCLINAANVDDFGIVFNTKDEPSGGIFDLKNPNNPVRDWNIVYVPNCTGDGHGGANPKPTDVPDGPSGQYFVGHLNIQKYLQRIVPTFPAVTDVLLAGMSSGGFGVLQNLVLVQRAFPKLKVRHVNDSGPPLGKTVIAECLQERFRTLWGLDQGALSYCGDSCPNKRNYLEDNAVFVAKLLADRPGGFIGTLEDAGMTMLFGIGQNECTGTFLVDAVPTPVFRAATVAYRERLKPFPNYGTFMPEGTEHTWLRLDAFYTASTGGVRMVDWFKKIADGVAPGHAGPNP